MSTQSAEWIQAARVLRRIGFGARGPEIDSALKLGGASSYVEDILAANFKKDRGVRATPMPNMDVPAGDDEPDETSQRRYAVRVREQTRELRHWWINRMVAVENPANEKLTFLWHNHFATSAAKVHLARWMAKQNQTLRDRCLGDFPSLAYAMLTDTALIVWLDGQENVAGSPNENLAREFLELFTLGHGNGYSEKDVREGARALTGWTISKNIDAKLVADRHDDSTKTILGTTGNIGLKEFCNIVVAKPGSAEYIAGKLWQQLASDNAPSEATLQRLVRAYGAKYDLRGLTAAILTDPEFLESSGTVVTGPVDWLIGLLRAVHAPMNGREQIEKIARTLLLLGQLPFYPPDVSGWPNGQAWLSSAAVNIRMTIASTIVNDGDVSVVAEAAAEDRLDATGYLIGVGAWSDRSAKALKPLRNNPTALVAAAVNTPEYLTS